jgi:hypothetical protein
MVGNACVEESSNRSIYLGTAQFQYTLQKFLPDIILTGSWQTLQLESPELSQEYGNLSVFQFLAALNYKLSNEWAAAPIFIYQGMALDLQLNERIRGSGAGLGLGQLINFSRLQYGVEQIASGFNAQVAGASFLSSNPNVELGGGLGLYTNIAQRWFGHIEGTISQSYNSELTSEVSSQMAGWLGWDWWFPLRSHQGLGGGWGPVLRSLTLSVNGGVLFSDESIQPMQQSMGSHSDWMFRPIQGKSPPFKTAHLAASHSLTPNEPLYLEDISLRMKMIGLYPRVTFWTMGVTGIGFNFNDPVWHVSIGL